MMHKKVTRSSDQKKAEIGDIVVIYHPQQPFIGCVGKVVGKRGYRTPHFHDFNLCFKLFRIFLEKQTNLQRGKGFRSNAVTHFIRAPLPCRI
jgi:hypothetical protein